MTARREIDALDAVRILRELRSEKEGWRRACADAPHHRGNPPAWFDQQDDYLVALDFAIGVLSAPEKPSAAPSKLAPQAAPPKPPAHAAPKPAVPVQAPPQQTQGSLL